MTGVSIETTLELGIVAAGCEGSDAAFLFTQERVAASKGSFLTGFRR